MAHPSTPAGAIAARLFRAAVLSVASLLLSTCARDVTAPPAPTQLAFLQQPENLMAGHQFSQTVKVRADDAHGNKVASFRGNVTVALANNPGGATLSGTTTVAAVDGIATFSDLSLDKTGAGYTLTASASGRAVVSPTSVALDVAPGPATQLEFTVEPTTATAGTALAPSLQVRALDAAENLVPTFTGNVTVAFGGTSGEGATLSGTTPVAAVSGVATFFDLSLNKTGTGYTLTASASGFAPVTSAAFDITPGTATQLSFTQQPSTTVAGVAISPTVQVTALDAAENPVPGFTGSVTIALGNNPGGSTLGGTTTVVAVNGVASFADLSANKTGTNYWLTATATGLSRATSSAFTITAGTATELVFVTEPGTTVANHQISPAVKVRALDAFGNVAAGFTGAVGVALGSNPGSATLSGTTPVVAVSGVATFFDLSVDKAGTGYTLTASASGVPSVTSTAFDVTPGTATQLAFTVQPANTVAGAVISPAVHVTALDAAGNPVPGYSGNVAVTLGNNPGGSTLGGTTAVATVNGVASFSTLTLDKTGMGYWLTASATGLSTATSSGFNITPGAATQLVFGTQPSTTVADHQISPAVKVRSEERRVGKARRFTGAAAVALGSNGGGSAVRA